MSEQVNPVEICEEAINYTNKAKGNIDILVKPLKDGQAIGENLPQLRNLLEGLSWLNEALKSFQNIYQLDYSSIVIGRKKAADIIESYNAFINQLSVAMDEGKATEFRKLLSSSLPAQMTAMKNLYIELQLSFQTKN